jgi:transcriptional regulator with XRE-family HTH domain
MDLRETFAANLRHLRNEKGLSQDDLAYEAGISRSYLSQLEKGAFYASLKIIGRLDDPNLTKPLNAALFPSDSGHAAELFWNRSDLPPDF